MLIGGPLFRADPKEIELAFRVITASGTASGTKGGTGSADGIPPGP